MQTDIEFRLDDGKAIIVPVSSAARQWCIDNLPNEALSLPNGTYDVPSDVSRDALRNAIAEGFSVKRWVAHVITPDDRLIEAGFEYIMFGAGNDGWSRVEDDGLWTVITRSDEIPDGWTIGRQDPEGDAVGELRDAPTIDEAIYIANAMRAPMRVRIITKVEGSLITSETNTADLILFMEVRGDTPSGFNHNPSQRAELQGHPKFPGFAGPMWDDGGIRYEQTEAYRDLSEG